jgi:hypothetical protein
MNFLPTTRDRQYFLLIPAIALVASLPLLLHGCSCGHDFDFHLLNWIEAATQMSRGGLHPHWAYTPAFNAGEPRFVFYPPVSWYLGALLGMLLAYVPGVSEVAAWTNAPILFTWIALAGSGLALYRLAREFVAPNAALIAAAFYVANPYMMFTAYERTAYAELLAAAWMPLLLLGVLRARITLPGIAVPLALLWLTNAPAAVMGSYTLAFLAAMRVVSTLLSESRLQNSAGLESKEVAASRFALTTAAGTMLGLALGAFYILPAAYERRFAQIALVILPGLRIQDNFLFEHTTGPDAAAHDVVLHTASMVAVLMLAIAASLLAASFLRRKIASSRADLVPMRSLAALAAGIAFMLTPWSLPLWSHVPQAAFLQFPWRLLAVLAVTISLALAGLLSDLLNGLRLSSWANALLALALTAALTFPAYGVFAQHCFIEDQPATRLALFHSSTGTDATDEYTPLHADNVALLAGAPPYWLADSAQASATTMATPGAAPARFTVTAPQPEVLILNLRDYPSWRIAVNGAVSSRRMQRRDGLIALPVPSGTFTIDIRYRETLDQAIGDAITLLALAILLFVLFPRLRPQLARSRPGATGELAGDDGRATRGTNVDVSAE